MSILFMIALSVVLLVGGIWMWRTSKLVSVLLLIPVVLGGSYVATIAFHMSSVRSPDSVDFTVERSGATYTVTGIWNESLDAYRYPTDVLVFYLPGDKKIGKVERTRVASHASMDREYLEESVRIDIQSENPPKWEPQIIDIEASKTMTFAFTLPDGVNPDDVSIYYGHGREESMEIVEFWFKPIDIGL